MTLNYEDFIIREKAPEKSHFVKQWISLLDNKTGQRFASILIPKCKNSGHYEYDKKLKEFITENLGDKFDKEITDQIKAKIYVNDTCFEFEDEFDNYDDSERVINFKKLGFTSISNEIPDIKAYNNEREQYEQNVLSKTDVFVNMLFEKYNISEAEMAYFVPDYKKLIREDISELADIEKTLINYISAKNM